MADEPYNEDTHREASIRIDNALYELLQEDLIPGGGVLVSSICIVETRDTDDRSRTFALFTDGRKSMLLGLLQVGSMHVLQ